MKETPLVSIVINNYNYSRFLGLAVDSALAQDYENVEVVVVDDGSTDNSREIISGYGSRVASVLKENGGQASAFNSGFAASHGEIIVFLDADDLVYPWAARRIVGAWRPGLAKAQYGLTLIGADGRPLGAEMSFRPVPSAEVRRRLVEDFFTDSPPTSGNAFDRRVLAKLLPMPEAEWRIAADTYLLMLCVFLGDVLSIESSLACYRVHGCNRWGAGACDLPKVRSWLRRDISAFAALRASPLLPVPLRHDWLLRSPQHVSRRVMSLRMDAAGHPFRDDRLLSITASGVKASLIYDHFALRKRIAYAIWMVLLALAPLSIASAMFRLKYAAAAARGRLPKGLVRLIAAMT
jgi:glycosyltransferase involved in cell wall biosynthesis